MRIAIRGLGATGSHIARQLLRPPVSELILHDCDVRRQEQVLSAIKASVDDSVSVAGHVGQTLFAGHRPPGVLVLAGPAGTHIGPATEALKQGTSVVSVSDDATEVRQLLELGPVAEESGLSIVVSAGFSPGLSCLLARYAGDSLDVVESISIYTAGTGGPSCARQHHRALKRAALEWRDGAWQKRRGGSGRDLVWFPDPFGARDCYMAELASPLLMQAVYPDAARLSARMSANRRDRATFRLPMLRPPHKDGGPGAIRVEVSGRIGRSVETVILGTMDHPSVAGATVAAVTTLKVGAQLAPLGASGLASWSNVGLVLAELNQRGVRAARFTGTTVTA